MDNNYFGSRIRSRREYLKKPMKGLADIIGVSVTYISDIERGRRYPPRQDILKKIAEFLELDYGEILEWALICRGIVTIDLTGKSNMVVDMALLFYSRFDTLTEEEARGIINILTRKK